jgi:hypothetical protein
MRPRERQHLYVERGLTLAKCVRIQLERLVGIRQQLHDARAVLIRNAAIDESCYELEIYIRVH